MSRKSKLLCHVMMITLILAAAMPVFAESGDMSSPRKAAYIDIHVNRTGDTQAESFTSISYYETFVSATVTLTLQEYKNGMWVTGSGVSPIKQSVTKYNSDLVDMHNRWNLTKGKLYRIECTTKDTTADGNFYVNTFCSNSF